MDPSVDEWTGRNHHETGRRTANGVQSAKLRMERDGRNSAYSRRPRGAPRCRGDLSRRALEALALEEYRCGHIGKADLRRLLGLTTRYELDGFLKAHQVWTDYTIEDFQHEREDLRRVGF